MSGFDGTAGAYRPEKVLRSLEKDRERQVPWKDSMKRPGMFCTKAIGRGLGWGCGLANKCIRVKRFGQQIGGGAGPSTAQQMFGLCRRISRDRQLTALVCEEGLWEERDRSLVQ